MTAPLLDISGLHYRYPGARSRRPRRSRPEVQRGRVRRRRRRQRLRQVHAGAPPRRARPAGGGAARRRLRPRPADGGRPHGGAPGRRRPLPEPGEPARGASTSRRTSPSASRTSAGRSAEIRRRVDEMLARFDLEELRRREPHLLSGGQKQRAALAGVLAIPRRVIVLDEPTAMLDPAGRDDVLAAVAALRAERPGRGLRHAGDGRGRRRRPGRRARRRLRGVRRAAWTGLFADGGLVRRLNLGLPVAGEVAQALARRGRPLPALPLTLDDSARGPG